LRRNVPVGVFLLALFSSLGIGQALTPFCRPAALGSRFSISHERINGPFIEEPSMPYKTCFNQASAR
jgi:hypothetical protein